MTKTDNTENTAAHTAGPWRYEMDSLVSHIVAPDPTGEFPDGIYVAEIANGDDVVGRFATYEQHEANARRICAAVNACEGISTEALERGIAAELVSALKRLVYVTEGMTVELNCKYEPTDLVEAKMILAKAMQEQS